MSEPVETPTTPPGAGCVATILLALFGWLGILATLLVGYLMGRR